MPKRFGYSSTDTRHLDRRRPSETIVSTMVTIQKLPVTKVDEEDEEDMLLAVRSSLLAGCDSGAHLQLGQTQAVRSVWIDFRYLFRASRKASLVDTSIRPETL